MSEVPLLAFKLQLITRVRTKCIYVPGQHTLLSSSAAVWGSNGVLSISAWASPRRRSESPTQQLWQYGSTIPKICSHWWPPQMLPTITYLQLIIIMHMIFHYRKYEYFILTSTGTRISCFMNIFLHFSVEYSNYSLPPMAEVWMIRGRPKQF